MHPKQVGSFSRSDEALLKALCVQVTINPGREHLESFEVFHLPNGSSEGQNMTLTGVLCSGFSEMCTPWQYGEILASREKFQEVQKKNETLSFLLSASRALSSQTALPVLLLLLRERESP